FGGLVFEPVEMGLPVGPALRCWGNARDISDCFATAAHFEAFAALNGVEHGGGLPVELAHGKNFHVRHDTPDITFTQALFLALKATRPASDMRKNHRSAQLLSHTLSNLGMTVWKAG